MVYDNYFKDKESVYSIYSGMSFEQILKSVSLSGYRQNFEEGGASISFLSDLLPNPMPKKWEINGVNKCRITISIFDVKKALIEDRSKELEKSKVYVYNIGDDLFGIEFISHSVEVKLECEGLMIMNVSGLKY